MTDFVLFFQQYILCGFYYVRYVLLVHIVICIYVYSRLHVSLSNLKKIGVYSYIGYANK
jgi:hypothetical protein